MSDIVDLARKSKKVPINGGPAFPFVYTEEDECGRGPVAFSGMSLRDWFAGTMQEDDRLVKCIRAMDDTALEVFALHPDAEREEALTEIQTTEWLAMPSEVARIARRLDIEARAIARVRYMQADAMLAESVK